ncbi:MAG: glycoside hydrolase family 5 protein [Dokdonella sp.]
MKQSSKWSCMPLLLGALLANSAAAGTTYQGVNLAGAEFGTALPGTVNVDFAWPSAAELDYFHGKGMNVVRLPFLWERMQPSLNGNLDGTYLAALDAVVAHAASIGISVLIDPHNYARYRGHVVGTAELPNAALADLWSRMATHFLGNSHVIFGLMNEPNSMSTEQWVGAANASISAIRATGAGQLILVPGNAWTGAHSWSQNWYGTANAVAMLAITDSANHFAFELHQYFDSNYSGTSATCKSDSGTGANELAGVTNWLRSNGRKGFLGEFAGANNADCHTAIVSAMNHLDANDDVWLGWTWWAAGPWWGDYMYSLEPTANFATDRAQMAWLIPYIGNPIDRLFQNGFESP